MTAAATDAATTGLSRTAAGDPVPLAPDRAASRKLREDPLVGWAAAVGVALLAFFLRVWKIGTPDEFAFDETYYAKDAWSLVNHGYVQSYVEDANDLILNGDTRGFWTGEPSMIVHPEVGKWLIGLGEQVFGLLAGHHRGSQAVKIVSAFEGVTHGGVAGDFRRSAQFHR